MQNKREFVLVDKSNEALGVLSLFFKTTDGLKYGFIPGQYVDVKPGSIIGHGKSYTISSTPRDKLIRLTVKKKGTVSSALVNMSVGEKIIFGGPHGNFYPESDMKDIVMIAGGIGVTPFYSVIKNKLESGSCDSMTLIYSNKTKDDIIFFDSLSELAKSNSNLKIIHCLTQEKTAISMVCEYCRIDKNIISKYLMPFINKHYYVCGSIGFVNDIWKALKEAGASEEYMYTESFY